MGTSKKKVRTRRARRQLKNVRDPSFRGTVGDSCAGCDQADPTPSETDGPVQVPIRRAAQLYEEIKKPSLYTMWGCQESLDGWESWARHRNPHSLVRAENVP